MNDDNECVRKMALLRLSKVLKIPLDSLSREMRFDSITPSFVSFFKRNEIEVIRDDVYDVAPSEIYKSLEKGDLIIITINDYVNHMIVCYSKSPGMVTSVLGEIEESE